MDAVSLTLQYLVTALTGDDALVLASMTGGMQQRRVSLMQAGLAETLIKLLVLAGRLQPRRVDLKADPIADAEAGVNKGLFMLKVDTIKVIANLSYRSKEVQDEFRKIGGIPVVLNHCNIDDANPFLKEWSIFAIRNLCENNTENQDLIAGMKPQGLSNDSVTGQGGSLEAMGLRASMTSEGRIRVGPSGSRDVSAEAAAIASLAGVKKGTM
ncbi:Ataxin-10 [Blyttiomyces sp. JEL0837]|nr:Ataxin-10 [Blyttiomyces sp. JEL0837]